ncbi:MAG: DUF4294 domain-containing protein [Chitinophagaceae bacterium]|nr:DUF4294 domain-containing protein [Chitinophagaceae bacterium]MDP1765023.1 DUF4294 domain-containing protein [Sediminibacterium sp.]MDP1810230.1 DUF4294 domain-containing protein [Sediminibacterium sp.]MDP3128721.1 DUF4294 domain-containing protein [Sediminibacterium sp.]
MKRVYKHIILSLCLLGPVLVSTKTKAQVHGIYDTLKVFAYVSPEGDTIPSSNLPPVLVNGRLTRQWRNYWADWTRLRNAVYVTYPYAKAASRIMNEINTKLVNVSDRKERKIIIKSREKELKKEFTDKLTKLSVYQGKVLMKLINRETGNNCYEIIDEYKGFISAAFWQAVAVVFGSNLKQGYDPREKDIDMEKIVRDVEKMYGYYRNG